MKNGNAGPKLHWLQWEKRGFPALPRDRYILEENNGQDGEIWAKSKLFLAYCLYIGAIFKKIQQKCCFGPTDSSVEMGPAFPIAVCRENGDAMQDFTAISRPAYSVYVRVI